MSTGRLEAFSDGVIAVAITLLVLDIHVPVPPLPAGTTLAHELAHAAVSSYLTLAICAGLGVFYAFPIGSGGSEAAQ